MKDLASLNRNKLENSQKKPLTESKELPSVQVRLHTITADEAGQRIDNFLLRVCKGVPKSHVYRILRSGEVRVNKGRIDQLYRLQENDVVRIPPVRIAESTQANVPKCEFPILFEDKYLLVVNKPAGVAVHGGSGVSYGVIEQLRASRPDASFLELVHRLDRETSGVLLLAKKRSALTDLHEQMRDGKTDKRYVTLVKGEWLNARQHVKLPLHKYTTADGERRVRVQADGQASHTIFNLRGNFGDYSLLEAELKTGRTHQIRVHLSASGFPIVGDDKYGDFALNKALQKSQGALPALKRMFLHAYQISFMHPETKKLICLKAELPGECEQFVRALKATTE